MVMVEADTVTAYSVLRQTVGLSRSDSYLELSKKFSDILSNYVTVWLPHRPLTGQSSMISMLQPTLQCAYYMIT